MKRRIRSHQAGLRHPARRRDRALRGVIDRGES
jgi:hypothetical protein